MIQLQAASLPGGNDFAGNIREAGMLFTTALSQRKPKLLKHGFDRGKIIFCNILRLNSFIFLPTATQGRMSKKSASDEVSETEVFEALEMFLKIRWAINDLTEEQKSQLDLKKLKFRGFDANNDKHYFFLEEWDAQNPNSTYREELGNIGGYNSHTKFTLAEYRGMLEVLEKFDLDSRPRLLTLEELQGLQNAKNVWKN